MRHHQSQAALGRSVTLTHWPWPSPVLSYRSALLSSDKSLLQMPTSSSPPSSASSQQWIHILLAIHLQSICWYNRRFAFVLCTGHLFVCESKEKRIKLRMFHMMERGWKGLLHYSILFTSNVLFGELDDWAGNLWKSSKDVYFLYANTIFK